MASRAQQGGDAATARTVGKLSETLKAGRRGAYLTEAEVYRRLEERERRAGVKIAPKRKRPSEGRR